jgi:hypothetical protein
LYLLAVHHDRRTVSKEDAAAMIGLTPTQRIRWFAEQANAEGKQSADRLLTLYETFLKETETTEGELIERFLDRDAGRELMKSASQFGKEMFRILQLAGDNSEFFRLLVV